MAPEPNRTRSIAPEPVEGVTHDFDPALDAGLAVAFAAEPTPGGWTQPPLLRDDASDSGPVVRPGSAEMPKSDQGRYQLLGEIARGGMGVILKGRDPNLGRDLAVKVLKGEYAGRIAAEQRFVEEAQVGGQLQHPGIIPVYELGRFADGRPFFTMKLVKGRTLAALLAERTPGADVPRSLSDRGRFLKHFERICETVAYAHSRGVIHRDLKPANIMVGSFGEVQVMDWGLAKVLPQGGVADELAASRSRERQEVLDEPTVIRTARVGSGGSDTQAGSVMGTPAFMPPEQAGGEIDKLDERADVFGLGAILSVILTGEPPYIGDDGEAIRLMAIRGKLDGAFARLDACGADAELIGLARRCLAPERDDRPRHAGEVVKAVSAYLADVEARAHRAEIERAASAAQAAEEVKTRKMAEAKAREERKRRLVQAALGMTFTALVVLGGAFAWWAQEQRRAQSARIDLAFHGAELFKEQAAVDPDNPVGRWQDAKGALAKAEAVLGEEAPPAVRARLNTLRSAIAAGLREAQGNRNLLDQIDRIRVVKKGLEADAAFAVAFQAAGVDVDALEPAEIATRLSAKPAAVRAMAAPALDIWAMFRLDAAALESDASGPRGVKHLFAAARVIDPDHWRNRLRAALEQRDLAALHALAGQADEIENQGPVYLWLLGLGHALSGDNKGAINVLRPAQRKYPGDYALNMELAIAIIGIDRTLASKVGGLAGAIEAAVNQEAAPHTPAGVAMRPASAAEAESAYRAAMLAAEAAYREALKINPKSFDARLSLARLMLDRNDYAQAAQCYREGIALQPNYLVYHDGLVRTLALAGKTDEAMAANQAALAVFPKYKLDRTVLCQLLIEAERLDEAADECDRGIAAVPKSIYYHRLLGFIRQRQGRLGEAIAAYRQTVELTPINLTPANAYCRMILALALAKDGRACEASDLLTEFAGKDPTSEGCLVAGMVLRTIKDGPGYELVRKDLRARFESSANIGARDHVVKVWLLDPNVKDELPDLTAIAERAVTEGELPQDRKGLQGWLEMTRGLAALRNRQWADAIRWCDAAPGHVADNARVGRGEACEAGCRAIKAIALVRQGGEERRTAARKELALAENILADSESKLMLTPSKVNFLFARVLADEAAGLLHAAALEVAPPPPKGTK